MKKSYLFSLVCLVFTFDCSFATEEDMALLDKYLAQFKELPETEKVAMMATKSFLDGQLAEDPEIVAAFNRCPEKRLELYAAVQGLRKQVKQYCWERLDDTYQTFLNRFAERSPKKRNSIIFDYQESELEIYLAPQDDVILLSKMPPEQKEPFYVLATLLQMDTVTERSHMERNKKRRTFLRRLLRPKA